MRLLVTGAAGAVGQVVLGPLSDAGHTVRAYDRRPTPGAPLVTVAELADAAALAAALDGVAVVVHLAAAARPDAPLEAALVPDTIVATERLLAAAVAARVRRVVLLSSIHVVAGYPAGAPVDERDPPRPISAYGASKVMVEALGRAAHEAHGLEIVAIRLGALRGYAAGEAAPRELARVVWGGLERASAALRPRGAAAAARVIDPVNLPRVAIGPGDTAQIVRCAVEAAPVGYVVAFATSVPDGGLSLAAARVQLGYLPRDRPEALFPRGWRPPS